MGQTNSASLDDLIKTDEAVLHTSDGYKTSCIDCWKPIKAYIIEA